MRGSPCSRMRTSSRNYKSPVGGLGTVIGRRCGRRGVVTVASFDGSKKGSTLACGATAAVAVTAASEVRQGLQLEDSPVKLERRAEFMEERIEKVIYGCRFFALLGVSGSLVGSILCFIKGTVFITSSFMEYFHLRAKVMSMLIQAIDVYLIGTVMIVFAVGLYELFISNLDIAKISTNRSSLFGLFMLKERPKWLEIGSVNELKTKLGHVIVMLLLVGLFEKSNTVSVASPVDLICIAASILLSSCGLYLLSKLKNHVARD